MRVGLAALGSALLAATLAGQQDPAAPTPVAPRGAPVITPPSEAGAFVHSWRFSDPQAFRVEIGFDGEGRPQAPVLRLVGAARYRPAVRSPYGIALWSGDAFGDFVLDLEMQQSGREYGHRDLCVFFGHRAHDRFYYVHLASKADPNAHNVFVVDGAPRRPIASRTTEGVDWGASDAWHRVRVIRRGTRIEVFFDDLDTPIMVADDGTHGVGRIGFGSFDDEGRFRAVRITGAAVPVADALGDARPFHRPESGGEDRGPDEPTRR